MSYYNANKNPVQVLLLQYSTGTQVCVCLPVLSSHQNRTFTQGNMHDSMFESLDGLCFQHQESCHQYIVMPPQSNQGRSAYYHDVTVPLDPGVLAEVQKKPAWYKLHFFLFILLLDAATLIVFLSPLVRTHVSYAHMFRGTLFNVEWRDGISNSNFSFYLLRMFCCKNTQS